MTASVLLNDLYVVAVVCLLLVTDLSWICCWNLWDLLRKA